MTEPSRLAHLAHGLHHAGNILVDIAAITGLVILGTGGVPEALAQALAGAIVSVTLGKKYADHKKRAFEAR